MQNNDLREHIKRLVDTVTDLTLAVLVPEDKNNENTKTENNTPTPPAASKDASEGDGVQSTNDNTGSKIL